MKNDTSGIYRIWINHLGKDYSYIGVSKNMKQRISGHRSSFRMVANNRTPEKYAKKFSWNNFFLFYIF